MHCIGSKPSGNLLGIVINVGKQGHKKKVYVYFQCFFFFFDIFTKLWKVSIGFVTSVCPSAWNSTLPSIQQIFMKLIFEYFLKLCQENSNFIKFWPVMAALPEDLCTFFMISCWILLRMRNVSNKHSIEDKSTCYVQEPLFWIVPIMR